ncbi:MAG: DNA repair protein RadC [Firmicutes bacterium]|nr:DNA repair protein RadC [Bacillota bacterium]
MSGLSIKSKPVEERPREKLFFHGEEALDVAELLAVVIGTGNRGASALDLANRLLAHFGDLAGLARVEASEVAMLAGIGPAKAAQVVAALALGKRISKLQARPKQIIASPREAFSYLWSDLRFQTREIFRCLVMDTKNQILANELVSIGTLNSSLVHPREVFKPAIARSAAGVILAHNHPSGDPAPSEEDIALTKRLAECGKLLGIKVLDHIIVGDNTFVSLREKGII